MDILEKLADSTLTLVKESKVNVPEGVLRDKIKEIDDTMGPPLNPLEVFKVTLYSMIKDIS